MDETTDITTLGQLGLHLRLVKDGVVRSRFGTTMVLTDQRADTITKCFKVWCDNRGIDIRRAHAGSNGGSTFAGRHRGLWHS